MGIYWIRGVGLFVKVDSGRSKRIVWRSKDGNIDFFIQFSMMILTRDFGISFRE